MPKDVLESDERCARQDARGPHAPEESWARRLLGSFHVTGLFWYRFHAWGVRVSPDWAIGILIAVFTTFFFVFLFKIRGAIAGNLTPVLGPCGWFGRQARIYRTMRLFAWCLSERYERLLTDRPFAVRVEGMDIWREVAGSGHG